MTAFLVVLVIILFGVAVLQLGKIFQMSKTKDDNTSEIASDKDNDINGYLMLAFVFITYLLLIVCFWSVPFACAAGGSCAGGKRMSRSNLNLNVSATI